MAWFWRCDFFGTTAAMESMQTSGWLPRPALSILPQKDAPARAWEGKWRGDGDAQITLRASGGEVEVSGEATWGAPDPDRVRRGAVHTGELEGEGAPRNQTLPIGYDDGSVPPTHATEDCAARLRLFGRYLAVEDIGRAAA